MPISRKKTCAQCRKAKARCSLTLPRCTRCIDKSLSCEYIAGTVPRIAPYSVNNTASGDLYDGTTELRALTTRNGHQSGIPPGSFLVDSLSMATSSSSSPPLLSSEAPVMAPSGSHSDNWAAALQAHLGAETVHDMVYPMGPIEPCQGVFSILNNINMSDHPTPDGAVDDKDTRLRNPITGSGTQSDFLVHDKTSCLLANRRGLTANAVLATRTIFGQVCSYPTMMVSGHSLPPFIHSRCTLDDSSTYNCAKLQKHECLRKTLSICAALVGMWLERTPVSTPFVWETIYNEVARMNREHDSYDTETLVESMQALAVYLLLQAQDKESLVKTDVKFLLMTLMHIGSKLHFSLEYSTCLDTVDNPLNRTTWVLYEAIRRTLSLLYIIEMFLEVNLREEESRCCQIFAASPLPCIRDLWEAPSTYEWKKRYKTFLCGRAVNKMLTLADYKVSQQLSVEELVNGSSIGDCGKVTKDVMRWCEGMDQFGTLITVASSLIKYELGPLTMGGGGYAKVT